MKTALKYKLNEDIQWFSKLEEIELELSKRQKERAFISTPYNRSLRKAVTLLKTLNPKLSIKEQITKLTNSEQQKVNEAIKEVEYDLNFFSGPRYAKFEERGTLNDPIGEFLIKNTLTNAAGIREGMHWKGVPLIKNIYDYSLYPLLLWELKPKTIIEIGSGLGASAIWMADLMKSYGLGAEVISLDIKKVEVKHPDVRFIQGDAKNMAELFPEETLQDLAHPWLIVHDEHYYLDIALQHFVKWMRSGDYFFREDSRDYQKLIAEELKKQGNCLLVDTYYTDYFGRNATSAANSIFIKVD